MRTISFSTFDMFQNHGLFLHLYRFGYFNRRISLSAKIVRETIFHRSCSRFYSASGPISCLRGSSPAGWVRVLGFRLGDGLGYRLSRVCSEAPWQSSPDLTMNLLRGFSSIHDYSP